MFHIDILRMLKYTYVLMSAYGNIYEFFLSASDYLLAAITVKGIPHFISPDEITTESQSLLFEGYFTYDEKLIVFMFAERITERCINLFTSGGKFLTTLINSIELE